MRKFRTIAIAGALALLTGCAASNTKDTIEPKNVVPLEFKGSIGGFTGPSYEIELKGGILKYSATAFHSTQTKVETEVKPSVEHWRVFRQTLDDMNVWVWETNYSSSAVDGTIWSLDLVYSDRSVHTQGGNNYPKANGHPANSLEPTKTFEIYLSAVQRILGGKDFK